MKSPISLFIKRLKWSDYAWLSFFLFIIALQANALLTKGPSWIRICGLVIGLYFSADIIYKAFRRINPERDSEHCNPSTSQSLFLSHIEEGEEEFQKGNFQESLALFVSALDDYPEHLSHINVESILLRMGCCCYELGNFPGAIAFFDQSLKTRPTQRAYFERGRTNEKIKQTSEAIEDYSKSIAMDEYKELSQQSHVSRAVLESTIDDHISAKSDLQTAIDLNPNDLQARSYLGITYSRLEEYKKAAEEYSNILHIDANFWEAYRLRGLLSLFLLDYESALEDLNTYKANSITDEEVEKHILHIQQKLKKKEPSIDLLKPTDNLEEWRIAQALLCRNAAYIFRYEKYIEMLRDDGGQTQVVEEFSGLRSELITEYFNQLKISFKYNDSYFLFRLRNLTYACMSINMNGKMNDDNEAFGEYFLYKIFADTDTRLHEVLNDEEIKKQSERANEIEEYIVYGCSIYCNKLLNLTDCGSREERDNGENYLRFLEIQSGLEQQKMFDEIYVIRQTMLWTIASTNIDLVTSVEESDSFEVKAFDILSSTNQCFTDYGNGPYRREEIIDALSRKQDWISKDAGKDAQVLIQDYRNELDTMSDDQLANEIHRDYSGDTRQFLNQWGNHGRVATTKEDPKERVINTEYTIEQLRQAVINDYAYLCFGDGGTQSDETSLEDFKLNAASMSWEELMQETSVIENENPKLNHPLSEYMETWLDRTMYAEMKYLKNEDGSTMLVN